MTHCTTGRTMGGFVNYGEAASAFPEKERSGRSLTTLVREERCEGCPWPDTCAADKTCWEEESKVADEQHADRRELRTLLGDFEDGVEIRMRHEPHEAAQKLLSRLGATYVVDPNAERCVERCGQPECREFQPKEEPMSATETEPTVATCKIEGCDETTTVLRGRYAGLCATHRAEAAAGATNGGGVGLERLQRLGLHGPRAEARAAREEGRSPGRTARVPPEHDLGEGRARGGDSPRPGCTDAGEPRPARRGHEGGTQGEGPGREAPRRLRGGRARVQAGADGACEGDD